MATLSVRAVREVLHRVGTGACTLEQAVADVADLFDRQAAAAGKVGVEPPCSTCGIYPVPEGHAHGCELCGAFGLHNCPQLTRVDGWYFDPLFAHRRARALQQVCPPAASTPEDAA